MPDERRYARTEVEEILKRAVARQHAGDDTTHAELLEVARELGIEQDHLEEAAAAVSTEHREQDARARMQRRRRVRFWRTSALIAIVNAFFVALNTWLPDGLGALTWSRFPLLLSALLVSIMALRAFTPRDDDAERWFRLEARRQRRRHQLRKANLTPPEATPARRVRVAVEGAGDGEPREEEQRRARTGRAV